MTLVGKLAPSFSAQAVIDGTIQMFSLENLLGSYVLLFFYPLDFTFVCPTELHAFQEALEAFEQRETVVVGCSVDSCFSHLAWLNIPKDKGGIAGVTYPLVSDIHKSITKAYGILKEEAGIAYRGLFLIDKQGIVRYEVIHDLAFGRSVQESLRMIDALQLYEHHGEVCPANWTVGQPTMRASQEGLEAYFSKSHQ